VILFLLIVAAPWVLRGALYLLAKYGGLSLRPIVPVFGVVCWGLWIASFVYLVLDNHHLQNLLLMVYNSLFIVYSWVKGESLFETHVSSVRSGIPASLLRVPTSTYIGVRDARSASDWYIDKLGMRKLALSAEGTVTLKFKAEDKPLILGPHDKFYPRPTPMLYTRKIQKAKEILSSRGVHAGIIERDRQGTHYFDVRDSEGNLIEVSEEPSGALGGEVF
jgi:catechol 2,3-dioxygenase-like lactoylglutathione lyase family enzyme